MIGIASATLIWLAAAGSGQSITDPKACAAGQACLIDGRLMIFPGFPASGAAIETADGCIPVALPPAILAVRGRWNHRLVTASGDALGRAEENAEVLSAKYKDRWLASGMCPTGNVVLYVRKLTGR
jgi:hypothetical protein